MPADLIHLVRHGEVANPEGILYGRLPDFHLSPLGREMAAISAVTLHAAGVPVRRIVASPLTRTVESAEPWAASYDLVPDLDERLIEPANHFEGTWVRDDLKRPSTWPWLINPLRPSWGEPYKSIAARMMASIEEAWQSVDGGDVVLVSHQLPIWMVHRHLAGESLVHDPRKRRCSLSSVTSIRRDRDRFVEADYQEPAAALLAEAVDKGAV
jgi:broad specificity phosphatase PhoE